MIYHAHPLCCWQYGNTPLHLAARYDHLGAARALIELGANVSIKNKVRWLAPGACVAGALVHAMPALTPSAGGGGAWMQYTGRVCAMCLCIYDMCVDIL